MSGRRIILPWVGLGILAAALFLFQVYISWPNGSDPASVHLQSVILEYAVLPRAAVAILAGAALGLAGLLLQRVLRNALAEPSTLGISAGAQLAMAVATLYAPMLMAWSVSLVAFAGGIAAVAIVLALTWRRGLEPVSVVLAGMMIALTANAASAALILANGDYLFSLFIWGGGSLVQQSWDPTIVIASRLAVGLGAALLLLRPLAILGLDDASARSLGVALHASRLAIVALAVWIATTVAAEVGVIGFVGLAAPALAALSGARTLGQRIVAAPLIGAILLWATDGLVQLTAGVSGERLPTGAATALLGGPLLLWILPRLRMMEWPMLARTIVVSHRAARPAVLLSLAVIGLVFALIAALLAGNGPDGWFLANGDLLADLTHWRLPRILVAAASGTMLAAAGVMIQRLTGNPLASPEILGVGAGSGAGLAVVLLVSASAGLAWQIGGAMAGALGALLIILTIAARGRFGPERLLLGGVATGAVASAIVTAVIAMGTSQSYVLLAWLTGSTSQADFGQAAIAFAFMAPLVGASLFFSRWLDILPLGTEAARSLGIPLAAARLSVIMTTALLTEIAALFVGPLSFIGLIAPHLARLLGLGRARHHLIGAMMIGATLMVVSDWLARMVAFPYQLPVGLTASMIGGPYLIYLLSKGVAARG